MNTEFEINKYIIFAEFAPKYKNISYAASFLVNNIEKQELEYYKKGLKNINHIYVREDARKKII